MANVHLPEVSEPQPDRAESRQGNPTRHEHADRRHRERARAAGDAVERLVPDSGRGRRDKSAPQRRRPDHSVRYQFGGSGVSERAESGASPATE